MRKFEANLVTDIHVGVRILHETVSDLTVTLIAPDGISMVTLHDQGGGVATGLSAVHDFVNPVAGDSMSSFDGLDPRGEWTLNIIDTSALGTGELVEWVLWIHDEVIEICGDGVREGLELCDGDDLDG